MVGNTEAFACTQRHMHRQRTKCKRDIVRQKNTEGIASYRHTVREHRKL